MDITTTPTLVYNAEVNSIEFVFLIFRVSDESGRLMETKVKKGTILMKDFESKVDGFIQNRTINNFYVMYRQLPDGDLTGFFRNGSVTVTNWAIPSVAKGWLSTLCCWEAAVHTLD